MRKVIFWGAGNIGRKILRFWQYHNMQPDFFCDNAKELWGKKVCGIETVSPNQVYNMPAPLIFVTCRFFDEIREQLTKNGISQESIIKADKICAPGMVYNVSEKMFGHLKGAADSYVKEGCFIDLSSGMVLGGVERWSYALADLFRNMGIAMTYLLPDDIVNTVVDKTCSSCYISSGREARETNYLDNCIRNIVEKGYRRIVCNFPFEIFLAACIVKRYINPDLHIIAIIHSDDECYYDTYCIWNEYVDECLVISERMRKKLSDKGFPSEKIKKLYWKISCDEELNRTYSSPGEPLRIGYGGRVTRYIKRLDLVVDVAESLKNRGIHFKMEIAGIGTYEDTLRREISCRGLSGQVEMKGLVDNKNIRRFWSQQDIYLSCSDREGHSISQSEAMAMGAVPIVTDVSGAEDDVKTGYNGYIVPLQDVDKIVSHIEYLYQNRELLQIMGSRSHDFIWKQSRGVDEKVYWKDLLDRENRL